MEHMGLSNIGNKRGAFGTRSLTPIYKSTLLGNIPKGQL